MNDIASYDLILINTSAGKDSQAMTERVCKAAAAAGVLGRVHMVHCDLGRVEWEGTLELAREHAKHYGVPFHVVKREAVGDLLAEVRRRGKWMSSTERYCTSYYKRDQAAKLYTRLANVLRSRGIRRPAILNCLGFRAAESPRRKKLPVFAVNARATNGRKTVHDWLPIHDLTTAEVWDVIKQAGTRPHRAYSLGMTRLSCCFCIFAPKGQLVIAARHNPELFADYIQVEKEIGHKFRQSLSLVDVQAAVACGETGGDDGSEWNM